MMRFFTKKKNLPKPSGVHGAACADLMTEFSQNGIFIRLYYPTANSRTATDVDNWFPWVPHDKYVQGLAFVLGLWVMVIRLVMWWYGGDMYVPALWEAKLLPKSERKNRKLPVIVFSHGFGAARFFCSGMLTELASHGYVVASLEHRDTSACATYFYPSTAHRDRDEKTWVTHSRLEVGAQHYELRNKQLKYRRDECVKVLDFLKKLNSGDMTQNILKTSLDLLEFQDQLDLDEVTIMGHSFGGATALLSLTSDHRFKQGVILDGWMFPLKQEDIVVLQPLLFINTPTFHISSNITVMEKIISCPSDVNRQLYIIKTSTHETQTDSPFVLGYWLDFFKPKIDPLLGNIINNGLILKFLHPYTGIPAELEKIQQDLETNRELIVEGSLPAPVPARKAFSLFS